MQKLGVVFLSMIEFYTEDARKPFLPPRSVDLFITHPPYFESHMSEYGAAEKQLGNTPVLDGFTTNTLEVVKAMDHALKDNGLMLIVLPNSPTFANLVYKIAKYTTLKFAPMRFWRNPGAENDVCPILTLYKGTPEENTEINIPSEVLDIPWVHEVQSNLGFTKDAMPEALCDILIRRYSKEGDTVADLLAGTGTVQVAALKLNRHAIYNDVSEEQTNIAKERIDGIETNAA